MDSIVVRIDQVPFSGASATAQPFRGRHSQGELAGMELRVSVSLPQQIAAIEQLLEKGTVEAEDPFASRSYLARIRMSSWSSVEGRPERSYVLEVRELDEPPVFQLLEIGDREFPVTRYSEDELGDDGVARHALLRLTPEEHRALQSEPGLGATRVRRIGVDDQPLPVRWGGAMFWSRHDDSDGTYVKQIVRFYPLDHHSLRFPLVTQHTILSEKVLTLEARLEKLLGLLATKGSVSEDECRELTSADWQDLLTEGDRIRVFASLNQVRDAEEMFP